MPEFVIDEEKCIQCGECVEDCPASVIGMGEYPYLEDGDRCIQCQHCLAICPTGALSILGLNPESSIPLQGNLPTPDQMATLIRGRRSVRRYQDKELDQATIRELLTTVSHAPTGVNAQDVHFTVLKNRASTEAMKKEVYERLSRIMASSAQEQSPEMRYLGWALKRREEEGIDVLFRGAPHVLVVSTPADSYCPSQDTLIALSYFDLMAQSMGIGTLWNGMLHWTLKILQDLPERMGIPANHQIGYVMVFGRPEVEYHRTVQRKPARMNMIGWDVQG